MTPRERIAMFLVFAIAACIVWFVVESYLRLNAAH